MRGPGPPFTAAPLDPRAIGSWRLANAYALAIADGGRTLSAPQDYFAYRNGTLTVEGVSLVDIAESTGTPVYVYSAEALLTPLHELQMGLAAADHLVCFAVKSNSNLAILKLLSEAGAGMDLVSGGELFRAEIAGVSPGNIVFSGVGKTMGEMASALEFHGEGIYSFNVESEAELHVLNAVASRMERTAQVALRFNPDVDAKTHPYISTGLKKNKFGIPRGAFLKIVREFRQFPALRLAGLSIHIGSQLLSLAPVEDAFRRVRSLIEEIEPRLPEPLSFVDLGGGVGITYDREKSPKIRDYCRLILKYFGPRSGLKSPLRILIEPGRVLSGNAGALITEVLYRKTNTKKDFLIVDAAMNDLIRPSLYGSYHSILPVTKRTSRLRKVDVVGPVCETGDCFASDRLLPEKLAPTDLVAILSAGAYGFTMSSNYNSRPRPPEILVRDGKFKVIRERESYDDLVRGEYL